MSTISNSWVTKTNVYKIQLHCHTTNSDGVDSPSAVMTAYKNAGYDAVCITDHDYATPDPEVADILFIPGVEETVTEGHMGAINMTVNSSGTTAQNTTNIINAAGGIAAVNHPTWDENPFTDAELRTVVGFTLFELWNSRWLSEDNYDTYISQPNRRPWIITTDDCHDVAGTRFDKGWILVNADECTLSAILAQIRAGNFYATQGPVISGVTLVGSTISVSTPDSATIEWIGKDGDVLKTTSTATSDTYTITDEEAYVRIRITRDSDSLKAWAQPVWIIPASGVDDEYTKVLLHFDGDNDSQDIYDEGGHPVGVVGNTCLKTAVKKFGASSVYFDGNGDYLRFAESDDLFIGKQAFCMEMWVRWDDYTVSGDGMFLSYGGSNDGFVVSLGTSGNLHLYAGADKITGIPGISNNEFYHIAIIGNGGPDGTRNIRLFCNGVQVGAPWMTNYDLSHDLYLGANKAATTENFKGYIDEFRFSIDDPRWYKEITPQEEELVYDSEHDVLLMHFNGDNDGTTFTDESGKTVTRYGNTCTKTDVKKYGSASGYFDGSGDYLKLDDSEDWDFGTGDFTIETWVYPTSFADWDYYVGQYQNDSNRWRFLGGASGKISFVANSGGTEIGRYITDTGILTLNAWNHVVVQRKGTSNGCIKMAVNGVDVTPVPEVELGGTSMPTCAGYLYIGQKGDGTGYVNGYLDDMLISKDIARHEIGYSFTPPTGPYEPPAEGDETPLSVNGRKRGLKN